ncbi:MAG: hypothetical protein PHR16_02715 [Methylovulum sp.]|nr:hypothetical protein [Methylovulum sp.]
MRKVVFHYHFFKNAGTSVDALLKANFPKQWVTKEFNGHYPVNVTQVTQWIQQEKDAMAFSSHTALLPPPSLPDIQLFPIIFIRHPIDRIASAYAFERTQGSPTFGSVLARHTTLAGYIEVNLTLGQHSQCHNFHISKLIHMTKGESGDPATLAIKALDSLPFVGLVDEYDNSIKRLTEWLSPHFPEFKPVIVTRNVTRGNTIPLEQKLEQIRAEIGADCYMKLLKANAADMAVFHAIQARYA